VILAGFLLVSGCMSHSECVGNCEDNFQQCVILQQALARNTCSSSCADQTGVYAFLACTSIKKECRTTCVEKSPL
ncbi:MAG TPA: hypothetical protein PKJ30_17655, partial [Leptospiraceae bacterium]|nr:hypothetical protein [Leptospiraceae bacterium]